MVTFKFSSKKNNLNKQLTLKNKDNIIWNILYIYFTFIVTSSIPITNTCLFGMFIMIQNMMSSNTFQYSENYVFFIVIHQESFLNQEFLPLVA